MISRFTLVGIAEEIGEIKKSQTGNRPTALMTLAVGDDTYSVILQGKLIEMVQDEKLRRGDTVYVEGRFQKDKTITLSGVKTVCVFYSAFVSVLETAKE